MTPAFADEISYDDSEASHKLRKLSLPTTLITYPPSPALSWEGDGPGSPRPRFRDGYFSNVFSSTPPNSGFDTSEAEFRINPYSPSGVDPPRPARTGFEWVWFPEGYWAEREAPGATRKSPTAGFLSKLRGRSGKSISDPGLRRGERSSGRDPSQKTATPQIATPFSPFFSEEAHVASLQHPLGQRPKYLNDLLSPRMLHESLALSRASEDDLTPIVEATVGTSEEEDSKAGVLCIPRRRKMKKSSRGESGEFRTPRPVEEASSVAPDAVVRSQGTSLSKSSVRFREEVKFKDDTNGASLVKKWFGKAPWHRKGSGETASSVTSSIREVLAGKTPPGTPVTESTCGSHANYDPSSQRMPRYRTKPSLLFGDQAARQSRRYLDGGKLDDQSCWGGEEAVEPAQGMVG
ncbi:hypothetical protein B0T11DRAFT_356554 [Plectosphaerella cucumerina]|uniref:Uncharacterized protein n=1 Tax=Plectosphaerella cucumerina TaxID=40658 RepID=A0A8K0X1B4_9PEZI|nr:hypothetical protein B0T11DRAFT_356554 [Plectosphaerella cucumerina]